MNTRNDLRTSPGTARRAGWDPLAVVSIAIAALVAAFYLVMALIGEGVDRPTAWVVAVLLAAIALGAYGVPRTAPRRRAALIGSGVILTVFGGLTIMSVGLLLIVAGIVMLVAGARS